MMSNRAASPRPPPPVGRGWSERFPALAALLWFLPGAVTVLFLAWERPQAAAATAVPALAMVFGLWRTGARRLSAFLPLGVGLACLAWWAPWQSYRRLLPRPECGAAIRAVVTEPLAAGEPHVAPAPPPATVRVALRALRTDPATAWQPCRGALLLRLPPGAAAVPAYGALIEAEGAFLVPEPARFRGDFDYRRHLLTTGVRHLFAATAWEPLAPCRGWRRLPGACLGLRDRALGAFVAALPREADAQVLAALLFGYRGGVPAATRERFIRSGTVHLFSVSGLHVAMLASILLLALRAGRVPFAARHLLLPPLLGVYVLMTGAAAPAQRAWVMITVWSVARAWLLPPNALNAVAVAALALLLANPFALGQSGFLFSFVLVFALVLGWDSLHHLRAVLGERTRWVPPRCRGARWRAWAGGRGLNLLLGSALAWMASAGLVAWSSSRLIPGAALVNVAMGLSTWLVLFGALLLLALGGLPMLLAAPLQAWLGTLLGVLLRLIQELAAIGSRWPCSLAVPRPAWWLVLLYHAALLALLAHALPRRVRLGAGAALAGLLLLLLAGPRPGPTVLVLHGATLRSAAVAVAGGALPPVVLDPPAGRAGLVLERWLESRGCDRLETVVASEPAAVSGALALAASFPVATLVLPEGTARPVPEPGPRLRHHAAAVRGTGAPAVSALTWGTQALTVRREPDGGRDLRLEAAPAGGRLEVRHERRPDGRERVTVTHDGAPWIEHRLMPTRDLDVRESGRTAAR